jgi:hypothetical protein
MSSLSTLNAPADERCFRSGLRALVAYLRPVVRPPLLAELSNVGLFVTEWAPDALDEALPPEIAQDLVVVFCDDTPEHEQIVGRLRAWGAPTLVVLGHRRFGPGGAAPGEPLITWDDGFGRLRDALLEMIKAARDGDAAHPHRLAMPPSAPPALAFLPNPPRIAAGDATIPLSPVEGTVFQRLVSAAGEPVGMGRLGARDPMPMSSAYLKTVVMRLRRKMQEIGIDPVRLSCVRGFGYVLRRD